jgi:hypothetical protein
MWDCEYADTVGMEQSPRHADRERRPVRRRIVLVCAYLGYLALLAAGVAGGVSLFAATGTVALALLAAGALLLLAAGAVLSADLLIARGGRNSAVSPLTPDSEPSIDAPLHRTAR